METNSFELGCEREGRILDRILDAEQIGMPYQKPRDDIRTAVRLLLSDEGSNDRYALALEYLEGDHKITTVVSPYDGVRTEVRGRWCGGALEFEVGVLEISIEDLSDGYSSIA